ncbi:hypothetical protein [Azospirillum doebereinerae]
MLWAFKERSHRREICEKKHVYRPRNFRNFKGKIDKFVNKPHENPEIFHEKRRS